MSNLLWKILPVYKILEFVVLGIVFDADFFSFIILGILVGCILLYCLNIQEHER